MAKRAKRKTTKRTSKKSKKAAVTKSVTVNRKAHWAAYKELQQRVNKQWSKLRANVARKAKPQVIVRDRNHLLLLLGECNYMARECMKLEKRRQRR